MVSKKTETERAAARERNAKRMTTNVLTTSAKLMAALMAAEAQDDASEPAHGPIAT